MEAIFLVNRQANNKLRELGCFCAAISRSRQAGAAESAKAWRRDSLTWLRLYPDILLKALRLELHRSQV